MAEAIMASKKIWIPYDKGVLSAAERHKNVGLNVGLNVTEKKVIAYLIESPEATADDIASAFGVSKRTIERSLKKLQEKGLLVRSGAKTGNWIVIK